MCFVCLSSFRGGSRPCGRGPSRRARAAAAPTRAFGAEPSEARPALRGRASSTYFARAARAARSRRPSSFSAEVGRRGEGSGSPRRRRARPAPGCRKSRCGAACRSGRCSTPPTVPSASSNFRGAMSRRIEPAASSVASPSPAHVGRAVFSIARQKGRANPGLASLLVTYRPLAYAGFRSKPAANPLDTSYSRLRTKQEEALTTAAASARACASVQRAVARLARPRRRGTPSRSWDRRRKRWRWRSRRLSCAARSARKARATL